MGVQQVHLSPEVPFYTLFAFVVSLLFLLCIVFLSDLFQAYMLFRLFLCLPSLRHVSFMYYLNTAKHLILSNSSLALILKFLTFLGRITLKFPFKSVTLTRFILHFSESYIILDLASSICSSSSHAASSSSVNTKLIAS